MPRKVTTPQHSECIALIGHWRSIHGYEPMEELYCGDKQIGWIRPCDIGKRRPQPWGTAADWPGEWEAIPLGDWSLSQRCKNYEAAKRLVESYWPNQRVVSSQPRHLTQKRLKEIAAEVANDTHKHYGCSASNRRRIYEALRMVQRETMAANAMDQRPEQKPKA